MKKILLIEDHEELRENAAEILALSDYNVLIADNGKSGVEVALKEQPDLIICDIMMPGLDGFGVLRSLQQHPETSGIPFIFLTARADKEDFRRGMSAGADDYLTKPFDGIELLRAVDACFQKKETRLRSFARHPDKQEPGDKHEPLGKHESTGKKGTGAGPDPGSGSLPFGLADRKVHEFGRKQMIYSEGQRPTHLHYIVKGKVKAYKSDPTGKEFITGIFGPGEFIGYHALLEDINYQDSVQVLEDARVVSIPRQEFLQLIAGNAEISGHFIKLLARNASEKEESFLNMAYNSLRKRVANGLLQVVDKFRDEQGETPFIGISRENLAHIIGSATESLTRTLSEFKQEKLIDIREGRIYLLNETRLRNLVN